ncbi:MAG: hypothetical protein ACU826_01200 [Gammaproteobacteria bacterium]
MKPTKYFWTFLFAGLLILGLSAAGCTDKMSKRESRQTFTESVEQAQTSSDHEAVAAKYEKDAKALLKKAAKHERLAAVYERTDNPKMTMGADAARHCRSIARKLREAAAESSALAEMHRQMVR